MPTPDPTDYYKLCQDGVMDLLRTLEYFSVVPAKQVTDNRNNLNLGQDYWAVFLPSSFVTTDSGSKVKRYVWVMIFDLYVRYKTASESVAKFMQVRASIINLLDVNPTLNGVRGVEEVSLATRSELLQDTPGDNPNFLIQTIAVSVAQRIRLHF